MKCRALQQEAEDWELEEITKALGVATFREECLVFDIYPAGTGFFVPRAIPVPARAGRMQ